MPLPGRTTRSNESLTQKNTLGTMGRTLMSTVSFAKPRGVNWADKRQGATVVETSSQPRVKSGIRYGSRLGSQACAMFSATDEPWKRLSE